MSDAPERIWAWSETDGSCVERFWIKNPARVDGTETEYVRADLHEALRAENERLRLLLTECADDLRHYVDHEYPENRRAQYPSVYRRWSRDMELVRRVRATIETKGAMDE